VRDEEEPAMLVHEIMTAGPVTFRADDTVRFAARLLVQRDVSSAPVVDDAGHVVGMVSEADLLVACTRADPRASLQQDEDDVESDLPVLTVAEVMSPRVLTLRPTDDVADAARLLSENGIKAAPVVVARHPVGVVARRDVLRALARPDADVRRDVLAALAELDLDGRVDVGVADGVVHLSSPLPPAQQRVAEAMARTISGVVRVQGPDVVRIDR
jgi:CBS domain-containing protein